MKRRTFIAGAGAASVVGVVAFTDVLGSEDEYSGDASDYLLTAPEVRDVVDIELGPGEVTDGTTLDGVESMRTIQFLPPSSGEPSLEFYALGVCESADRASEIVEEGRDRPGDNRTQDVGDESYSAHAHGSVAMITRSGNVFIDIAGTVHVDDLRAITEHQISVLE